MLEGTLIRVVMVAFFILANSFFVAAEFALVSLRETRVEHLLAQGKPGARTVLQLKRNMNDFLPAVQFGVTLAALALGWVGEPAVSEVLTALVRRLLPHPAAEIQTYITGVSIVLAFAVITYFEVLLGELVPKALALQRSERIALAVAGPMDVFIRMTRPAVRLMNGSAALVLRLFKAPLEGESEIHSPEELKLIASATRSTGMLRQIQEEMIHRAIELSHVAVREIMTPRGKIFSLPADMPLTEASARIVEEQHSRVPVYDPAGGPERIIGVVFSKEVARLMHYRAGALASGTRSHAVMGEGGLTVRGVMRETLFVPGTKLAVDLLEEFQERHQMMAIVVDEFGSTIGLVTAEDAVEQLVGELEDEFDVKQRVPTPAVDGVMTLDGSSTLRDLTTQLGWVFPRKPGVETLAGFLLSELGHLPQVGESVEQAGRVYAVAELMGRRISRVRIEPGKVPVPGDKVLEEDGRESAA